MLAAGCAMMGPWAAATSEYFMTLQEALALVAIGGVAGLINVLSTGGSMLTLPLMFLGLAPQVANVTNRVLLLG
ncbi:hypothetical protein SAMN05192555_112118 [Franzmannia pantelleriensis]|uniref:Uncharacterized protein n=1 Tax=Franzmannia pantelleriensis TaxID=48727 RepID=A0A1G9SSF9_9GAMM|nr:hypothetical protein [Halomonas pantelleriensis]SDM38388.1 hypothetical protein SAMN05192555_112118 [Halomonas pantelleriensis]